MRNAIVAVAILIGSMTSAMAQVSVGVALPGVNIGINVPVYPELVPVPGYPVYYAPQLNSNYFFYDGRYWVFSDDNWYDSAWYNGPWELVSEDAVPLFLLRVPVRYYRRPPSYFRGWALNGSPRWGDHWGNRWVDRHRGWDRWDRDAMPRRAPLPVYQRQYSGDRYPRAEQQQALHGQNYRYAPRNSNTGNSNTVQRDRTQRAERVPASPQVTRSAPETRAPSVRESRGVRVPAAPPPVAAQRAPSPRQAQAPAPAPQQRGPQGNGAERGQGNGQERGRGNAQERGRGNGQEHGRANPDNQQ